MTGPGAGAATLQGEDKQHGGGGGGGGGGEGLWRAGRGFGELGGTPPEVVMFVVFCLPWPGPGHWMHTCEVVRSVTYSWTPRPVQEDDVVHPIVFPRESINT